MSIQNSQVNAPFYQRRLTRSLTDKWIAGVAGGIAETYGINPTLLRLLFVLGTVLTSGGLALVYIAAWVIMPSS